MLGREDQEGGGDRNALTAIFVFGEAIGGLNTNLNEALDELIGKFVGFVAALLV